MSDIFFEIYRRLLPTPPSHKVESRRNFPLKTFLLCLPVAWKFESFIILKCENLKLLLFSNVRPFFVG